MNRTCFLEKLMKANRTALCKQLESFLAFLAEYLSLWIMYSNNSGIIIHDSADTMCLPELFVPFTTRVFFL